MPTHKDENNRADKKGSLSLFNSDINQLHVRDLGFREYQPVWRAMQALTAARHADSSRHLSASNAKQHLLSSRNDELWFVEHDAVFTLGHAADPSHVLAPGDIPVVEVDRGGQVTYHGPGQLVGYVMIDLRGRKFGVRRLVEVLELSIIEALSSFGIVAEPKDGAPGVYVTGRKIASIGLRVKRGCSYHGFSINIDVDKSHFQRINPCGYAELEVVNLCELFVAPMVAEQDYAQRQAAEPARAVSEQLKERLCALLPQYLGYNACQWIGAELPKGGIV